MSCCHFNSFIFCCHFGNFIVVFILTVSYVDITVCMFYTVDMFKKRDYPVNTQGKQSVLDLTRLQQLSPQSLFWIGYMYANAAIGLSQKHRAGDIDMPVKNVVILVRGEDKVFLEKFLAYIGSNNKIVFAGPKGNRNQRVVCKISSLELAQLLLSYGVTEDRARRVVNVQSQFANSKDFWRGYLTGNSELFNIDGPDLLLGPVQFCVQGTKPIMDVFQDYLKTYIGIGFSARVKCAMAINQSNDPLRHQIRLWHTNALLVTRHFWGDIPEPYGSYIALAYLEVEEIFKAEEETRARASQASQASQAS